jgi:hypothetical protein
MYVYMSIYVCIHEYIIYIYIYIYTCIYIYIIYVYTYTYILIYMYIYIYIYIPTYCSKALWSRWSFRGGGLVFKRDRFLCKITQNHVIDENSLIHESLYLHHLRDSEWSSRGTNLSEKMVACFLYYILIHENNIHRYIWINAFSSIHKTYVYLHTYTYNMYTHIRVYRSGIRSSSSLRTPGNDCMPGTVFR